MSALPQRTFGSCFLFQLRSFVVFFKVAWLNNVDDIVWLFLYRLT
jgi:hypothetical protein